MIDDVDTFIIRETNNLDKLTIAVLAAAIVNQKENVTVDDAVEIYSSLFVKMREKKLVKFP